jgi:ankyrin repeat protein
MSFDCGCWTWSIKQNQTTNTTEDIQLHSAMTEKLDNNWQQILLPPLQQAVINNNLELVKDILSSGTFIDAKDEVKSTLLVLFIILLVTNPLSQRGNTALHYAIMYDNLQMVILLVTTYGANVSLPCKSSRLFLDVDIENSLALAQFHGHDKIEDWLKRHSAHQQRLKNNKAEELMVRNTFYFTSVWCTAMLVVGFWLVKVMKKES